MTKQMWEYAIKMQVSKLREGLHLALILAIFFLSGLPFDAQACDQKICLEDPSCSGNGANCGTPNGNCTSYAFNANCTATYQLHSEVACQSGCHHCDVCVMVEEIPSGKIVGTCSNACGSQYCSNDCTAPLVQGQAYKLWVCKTPCLGYDCDDCSASCRAWGCLCTGFGGGSCAP
jgi:hypothetical protein